MIFTIEETNNSTDNILESMNGTKEELLDILAEATKYSIELKHKFVMESIMFETKYIEGEANFADKSIVMESSFKDFLEASKASLIELKNKIVAWFMKMISNIKLFLSNYEGFIKKNKDKLEQLQLSGKKVSIKLYDVKSGCQYVDYLISDSRSKIDDICTIAKEALKGGEEDIANLLIYIEDSEILLTDSQEIISKLSHLMKDDQPEQEMIIPTDIIITQLSTTKEMLNKFEKYKKDFEKSCKEALKMVGVAGVENASTIMNSDDTKAALLNSVASISVLLQHIPKVIFFLCETNKKITLEYTRISKNALKDN